MRDKKPEFKWIPLSFSEMQNLLYPELIDLIYQACHNVHFILGPGFLHQIYRRATRIELLNLGLNVQLLKNIPITYKGHLIGQQEVRLLLVEDRILLATFALKHDREPTEEYLKSLLRNIGLKLGVLANFYGTSLNIKLVRVK